MLYLYEKTHLIVHYIPDFRELYFETLNFVELATSIFASMLTVK